MEASLWSIKPTELSNYDRSEQQILCSSVHLNPELESPFSGKNMACVRKRHLFVLHYTSLKVYVLLQFLYGGKGKDTPN
jgi:hypothetical protein